MHDQGEPHILIAPANHAGQGLAWSRALRASGVDADVATIRRRPTLRTRPGFEADYYLPYPRFTTKWDRAARFNRLVRTYTHVAIDGFMPPWGSARELLKDAPLTSLAKRVDGLALIAHGTDVRDPDLHQHRLQSSYFVGMPAGQRQMFGKRAEHNRRLVLESGLDVLVSTPDLLIDLPQAEWLPVVIETAAWECRDLDPTPKPKVVHVPSSGIKGSDAIDPVLEDLARVGAIEYVRAERLTHERLREVVLTADVVVDQVRSGSYGVAAVEAMAAGKIVVGHVAGDVRALVPDQIPIFDAPAHRFRNAFSELLDLRSNWPETADRSRRYVQRWHSGSISANILAGRLLATSTRETPPQF